MIFCQKTTLKKRTKRKDLSIFIRLNATAAKIGLILSPREPTESQESGEPIRLELPLKFEWLESLLEHFFCGLMRPTKISHFK